MGVDQKLGLVLFILMFVQVALGCVAHWVKRSVKSLQTASGRGPTHFMHVGLGIVTVVIGWVTVWFGEQHLCIIATRKCTDDDQVSRTGD